MPERAKRCLSRGDAVVDNKLLEIINETQQLRSDLHN